MVWGLQLALRLCEVMLYMMFIFTDKTMGLKETEEAKEATRALCCSSIACPIAGVWGPVVSFTDSMLMH